MTNYEETRVPSLSTGLVAGMLIGITAGLVLGPAVFGNLAIGLVLGSGAGGVLGIAFPAAWRSQRASR
ncbi:hypothetical protein IAG44_41080 [Streptomyces roseirectus]|uniref:Uncharacterized protein n=1 Tax=Streptomyces roseirectus TaxID=2768066 RepID=A0A7H0IQW0_9ACTN|nr:hypothetical protein [Streptomyces roseirectus]QNP75176.1 hypothetical protein IAG44_41080 [Streptomyces roseirectus]